MKKLHAVYLARLRVLEFGQFIKSSITNTQAVGAITDANTLAFLTALIAKSDDFDLAMMHIAKSDETIKIEKADAERDQAITVFTRQLSVHEFAETEPEAEAYASMTNLMNVYNGMQSMNYEQESNAIDNFLTELNTPTYSAHVGTLQMDAFVVRLTTKNTNFKTLFEGRTQETAAKPNYDTKVLRNDLKVQYQDFANYIVSIANLQPTSQANNILNVLNVVRKYYHDLLAIRAGKKNDETPIPVMPVV